MKIVILCLSMGIGDVIMTTPLIGEVKKKFPDSRITVLVSNESCKDVLTDNPNIEEINILKKSKSFIEKYFPLKSLRKLILLKKKNFDLSITCFPHALYSTFCARIINARRKFGHKIYFLDKIYEKGVTPKDTHQIKQNLNLIEIDKLIPPKIFIEKSKRNYIGIHPGSDSKTKYKRWNIKKFIEVAKIISHKNKIKFFFGPDEQELKEDILKSSIKNYEIIENSNFYGVILEVNKCHTFISNDSGLMHVAEALNIPLIALFGATDEIQSAPVTKNSKIMKPEIYFPFDGALQRMGLKKPKRKENRINEITSEAVLKEIENVRNKRV